MSFFFLVARAHRSLGFVASSSFQVRNLRSSFSSQRRFREPQSRCIITTCLRETAEQRNLTNILKEAYDDRDTDGVLEIMQASQIVEQLSNGDDTAAVANKLVTAAMNAADAKKNLVAILNAILASCCGALNDSVNNYPQISMAILDLIDRMHDADESTMIKPDLVTLSLVYYSLCHRSHQESAQLILERAERMSKKEAGSSRRRALAAERRKGSNIVLDVKEAENKLQSLYGPDIHILQETDDLIVFSKPSGQVCYHNRKTSAGKISASRKKKKGLAALAASDDDDNDGSKIDISLEDALLDMKFPLSTLNPVARGIVHRLDRGTSGCICLAKTNDAHMKLIASFFLRRASKKYLALVPLSSPLEREGVIDALVDGKSACSKYRVLSEYYGEGENQGAALLEVETYTGRKHQVRVHCSMMGNPIFLDPLYSPVQSPRRKLQKENERKKSQKADHSEVPKQCLPKVISDLGMTPQERFFLHAHTLSIPELNVDVQAPIPLWWPLDQLQSR